MIQQEVKGNKLTLKKQTKFIVKRKVRLKTVLCTFAQKADRLWEGQWRRRAGSALS